MRAKPVGSLGLLLLLLQVQVGWLALSGCAAQSGYPPAEQMALAEQAITRAQQAGAERWSEVEWLQARRLLADAASALERIQYAEARQQAELAQAWAELATVRAQRAKADARLQNLPRLFE